MNDFKFYYLSYYKCVRLKEQGLKSHYLRLSGLSLSLSFFSMLDIVIFLLFSKNFFVRFWLYIKDRVCKITKTQLLCRTREIPCGRYSVRCIIKLFQSLTRYSMVRYPNTQHPGIQLLSVLFLTTFSVLLDQSEIYYTIMFVPLQ